MSVSFRFALSFAFLLACTRAGEPTPASSPADAMRANPSTCPAHAQAPSLLPNTPKEVETLDYWLANGKDELLLDEKALSVQDQALRTGADGSVRLVDLTQPLGGPALQSALQERLSAYREGFDNGQYQSKGDLKALDGAGFSEQHELRVALAPLDLRCVPFRESIATQRGSEGFDRNRCSQARAQEPIEILGRLHGMRLARTASAFGFIADDAKLSPVVDDKYSARFREHPTLSLQKDVELAGQKLSAGTLLRGNTLIATATGIVEARALKSDEATPTARPLTRHAFLREAFRYLRTPYGWGDANGGRDCSRFVLDVLATFGLGMPRTSANQSRAGRYSVEVPESTSETE
ncbi:MAG TPA: NlpC/P60 family protein, partial [Polyangiales bacterium]